VTVAAGLTVTQDFSLTALPPPCQPVTGTDFTWAPDMPTVAQVITFTAWSGGWLTRTIDNSGWVGRYTSLALDSMGRPHISYWDQGNNSLKYAHYDGNRWQVERVDAAGDCTSLALDAGDHPHIAYCGLKYAYHDGSDWHITYLGPGWHSVSLSLDDLGRPHIAYHTNALDLAYTYYDGSDWHQETVDTEGDVGKYLSMALDSANRPHISYVEFTTGTLKYAHHDGTVWQIQPLGSGYESTSLQLDAGGQPHIGYYAGLDGVEYASFDGTTWHTETVDQAYGMDCSLALDSSDQPHLSYFTGDLIYAYNDGSSWQTETVDGPGYVGAYTSIALDAAGQPHISYYGDPGLRYARFLPIPTPPITYTWSFGDGSSFVVDPAVTHTYALPGAYTVTLTATNACGEAVAAHRVVVVAEEWRVYLPLIVK
jgi:hypothetical protein